MKRQIAVALVALSVLVCVTPVFAWEFSIKGDYEYRFRYFGRTGDTDLFGQASLQENTGIFIGFAGPNIYGTGNLAAVPGDAANSSNPALARFRWQCGLCSPTTNASMRITRGGFSRWGSDARYNDSRFTLRPMFRLNPAIRVFGVYTIGGMRNKYKENNVADLRNAQLVGVRGDLGSSRPRRCPAQPVLHVSDEHECVRRDLRDLGTVPYDRENALGPVVRRYEGLPLRDRSHACGEHPG